MRTSRASILQVHVQPQFMSSHAYVPPLTPLGAEEEGGGAGDEHPRGRGERVECS